MAVAKCCDRCNKFYKPETNPSNDVISMNAVITCRVELDGTEKRIRTYDLCPACVTKLKTFLGTEETASGNA